MAGKNIDVETFIKHDQMAAEIAQYWTEWNNLRQPKLSEWKELIKYLYATDTTTTSNALLPWSNTTTTPKLTQISDNLHANYVAALFPRRKWMRWEASAKSPKLRDKKKAVEAYMQSKLRASHFVDTMTELAHDYVNFGNCFATVDWVNDFTIKKTGGVTNHYTGPVAVRISPYDICFNPTAPSFEKAPKIIRQIMTLGEAKRLIDTDTSKGYYEGVFDKMMHARQTVKNAGNGTSYEKGEAYTADGFSDIRQYYGSNYVEILTFYGDIYDQEKNEYLADHVVTIVDRAYVLQAVESPSWLGSAPIFHAGWRKRPDNLWAMGPLDNLVGMQYRIDHLENLKADVFDQIGVPMLKIKGEVEDFDFAPGERIYLGEEGEVSYLAPDSTALNADFQIAEIERKMEELAGAPRAAMGIRTPGEKTAFEVDRLETSANRIFEHRTAHFESVFVEPLLNAMLEAGRRNMEKPENVKVFDEEVGQEFFQQVKKSDLQTEGYLYPLGARHFAERARRVQNINQLYQIKAQDPSVGVHISGKKMAEIITEEMGEEELYGENIALEEQNETLRKQEEIEVSHEEELADRQEVGV